MKKIFFIIFTILITTILGFVVYVYSEVRFDIDKIVDYKPKLTTRFYDKNDELVANIFDEENRIYVKYEEIPSRVIESLLAIEDTDFFEHGGINVEAIFRAIVKDIKHGKLVEGASTLTQQLVKTMILTREKKLIRKVKEALLSLRLESILTKEEILERYLNEVYFGHGYYGIRTASLGYFNKELSELSLKEIAMLVGLPRAPSFYDPTRNIKFSLSRANQVVNRMHTLGWISETEYQEAIKMQPEVFNQTLTQNKAPYVIDYALMSLQEGVPDIKYGGYDIKLTIDLKTQNLARESLMFGYEKIKIRDAKFKDKKTKTETLNGAIVTIENNTGKILALVGGVDYTKSSFNRAVQSKRQLGSAVKPFLYQIALNLGYSTASNLIDISRTYNYKLNGENKKWQPQNYERNYEGLITLREALIHSRNLATINLANEIGVDVMHRTFKQWGFEEVPMNLSITLGTFSVSPLEVSSLYTIFSNNGLKVTPYLVESVSNQFNQEIIFEPYEQFIEPPEQAYLITSVLEDVVKKGTARLSKVKGIETAGKTGTTNDYTDAWFCGYTPTTQTVIWYGNDDNTPMRRTETGGRSSGTVFSHFYTNYLKIHPELKREFDIPDGVKTSYIGKEKEFFTDMSPLPPIELKEEKNYDLLF